MIWQAVIHQGRRAFAKVRARVNPTLLLRVALGTLAVGFLLITGEAALRAHLVPPSARVPTTIYARPVAWGTGAERPPAALGVLPGAPAEARVPVRLSEVPEPLIDAVLAVEDQRFYRHHGIDIRRIGGAFVANVRAGRIAQGGSTITQQLAKNLFLHSGRTPLRKLREAAMAVMLEERSDKATILEAYLNEVYFGQDGGLALHGVGAAARYFFGKEVRRLTVSESALLAGMIQAPNRYNPIRNAESARDRRDLVLGLMAAQGRIDDRKAARAVGSGIRASAHSSQSLDARYFRDVAMADFGRLPSRGGAAYTTLDTQLQYAANRAVRDGIGRLRLPDAQVALVALDPRNGDVLALVGGRDYGASQFNRATEAQRQPGSAFKPIVALAALSRDGRNAPAYTLASRVEDAPLSVGSGSTRWEPSNYDRTFRGDVTVREAIEQSLNVPVARIGLDVGPERIVETARRLGITSRLSAVPSLALGSSEVTLLELVRAYGVFASGGQLAATRTVLGKGSSPRDALAAESGEVRRAVDAAEAYLVTSALQGVIDRGTGRTLNASRRFGAIAGKTGTSNDWRDAWFVAYTPSLVVGVWVGYDDGRSLGLTGANAALPVVSLFLERVESKDRAQSFPVPDGIEIARVQSGQSSWWGGWDCGDREVFLEGTAPESDCLGARFSDWVGERFRERDWDDDRDRAQRAAADYLERLLERVEKRATEARRRSSRNRGQ